MDPDDFDLKFSEPDPVAIETWRVELSKIEKESK